MYCSDNGALYWALPISFTMFYRRRCQRYAHAQMNIPIYYSPFTYILIHVSSAYTYFACCQNNWMENIHRLIASKWNSTRPIWKIVAEFYQNCCSKRRRLIKIVLLQDDPGGKQFFIRPIEIRVGNFFPHFVLFVVRLPFQWPFN